MYLKLLGLSVAVIAAVETFLVLILGMTCDLMIAIAADITIAASSLLIVLLFAITIDPSIPRADIVADRLLATDLLVIMIDLTIILNVDVILTLSIGPTRLVLLMITLLVVVLLAILPVDLLVITHMVLLHLDTMRIILVVLAHLPDLDILLHRDHLTTRPQLHTEAMGARVLHLQDVMMAHILHTAMMTVVLPDLPLITDAHLLPLRAMEYHPLLVDDLLPLLVIRSSEFFPC